MVIEMVQKRAMRAIFWQIKLCYNASLEAANLLPLTERRAILSEKFIAKNKHSAGPLNNILSSMSAPSSYHGATTCDRAHVGVMLLSLKLKDFLILLHVNIDNEWKNA